VAAERAHGRYLRAQLRVEGAVVDFVGGVASPARLQVGVGDHESQGEILDPFVASGRGQVEGRVQRDVHVGREIVRRSRRRRGGGENRTAARTGATSGRGARVGVQHVVRWTAADVAGAGGEAERNGPTRRDAGVPAGVLHDVMAALVAGDGRI